MEKIESKIKSIASYNPNRLDELRALRKKYVINFCWVRKYSETTEPDKYGRWAEKCVVSYNDDPFDGLCIGYIHLVQTNLFNYHIHFPIRAEYEPTFSDICYMADFGKEIVELMFVEFYERLKGAFYNPNQP